MAGALLKNSERLRNVCENEHFQRMALVTESLKRVSEMFCANS